MGDRGSTGESHVARLFQFAPPMCSVHGRTGHGHALRLVRLATRQLTAVSQPLQGSVSSARSGVPLRVRSITTGIGHLRSRSFIGPQSTYDSARCVRLRRRIRRTCSRALSSLADSDPTARSALRIRKEGKSIASNGQAWSESAKLCILSERLTLVTATSIGQSLLQLFVCCANNGLVSY